MTFEKDLRTRSYSDVRRALLEREEIALVDVREEDPHARSHPLFAANLPLSRLELDAPVRLPRRDVPIVVLDDGEGLANRAAERLAGLGYTRVALLEGGLQGWRKAGGELFQDVNVPSKAFGELVESVRHTPSLPAQQVQALLDREENVVVLDARRFDEYQTMNIPGSISVPGAELVLRARELAPDPTTRIIVNCAGRTRSIIGAQSLINAGVPNPVAALRNGTIGWTLAGQPLAHGSSRRPHPGRRRYAAPRRRRRR
ncbi:sulfurtransferase, partial [Paraburkholderia strydomiana]